MATTTITTTNNYHNHHYQEEEKEEKSINNYKYVDELCTDISDYLEYLSKLAKKEIRSDEKIQLSDSVYKFIEDYKNYKNNPFPAFSNNMYKEDIDGKDVRRREGRRGGFWKYSKFDEEAFNEKIQNYILSTSSSQNITKVDNINVLGLLESFYDAIITSNVNYENVEAHDDATITKDKETSSTSYDNDDGDENSSAVRLLKSIKHNNDLIIKNNDLIKSSSFSSYLSSPEYLFNFNHLFDSSNYSKWDRLDSWMADLWNSFSQFYRNQFGAPNDQETNDAILFGYLVVRERSKAIIAHFHEWLPGVAIALFRKRRTDLTTIFTIRATLLVDEEEAGKRGIYHRYCIECAAFHCANVFITVSQITAYEAELLLK
ncbi:12267_t:CDS:2 [Entrophospora sp. SA101]|nr:12267_t:CDS:2 [Entrophospora sp. SA101]CAJ0838138.1 4592_t:CDS:2 [Entrophospora sp. SA101]